MERNRIMRASLFPKERRLKNVAIRPRRKGGVMALCEICHKDFFCHGKEELLNCMDQSIENLKELREQLAERLMKEKAEREIREEG